MTLTLDRTKAPEAYDLKTIHLLHTESVVLSNGLKVFCINGAEEEVIKLELVFKTGTRAESKKLVASACNYLLNAGSTKMSSSEIMEKLDFYGSFYQHDNQLDRASISIYTLKKYFKETLDIFADIILDPVFPEEELAIYKENAKQRFLINITKNDYRARREFHNALYGNHPYGKLIEAEDYDALTREDVLNFYKEHYTLENASVLMTGNFGELELKMLENVFQVYQFKENTKVDFLVPSIQEPIKIYNERPEALQSAIRIGKQIMHKTDVDYIEFSILTTVLGGYFGSRLMSNIREDKGYTYGIGAGVYPLLDSAFFYIATEVGTEVTNAALEEIYKEIERLRIELIPEEELNLVKNYLKGSFIGSIENIFSHADKFKSVYLYNLNYDYYDRYFKLVDGVSSERLLQLSKEYLTVNSLTEVVIGKK
jgi:predicted Zn-dependent peptidase